MNDEKIFNLIKEFGNFWWNQDGTEIGHMEFFMKKNPDDTIEFVGEEGFKTPEIEKKFDNPILQIYLSRLSSFKSAKKELKLKVLYEEAFTKVLQTKLNKNTK